MQNPPKLVCPTMHGIVVMAPNIMVVTHLMEEHFPKYILMATLECVIGVTTILVTPKNHGSSKLAHVLTRKCLNVAI